MRTRKRVVVLGGGAVGKLVKLRVPNAVVLDSASKDTPPNYTWGVNYLHAKVPAPGLKLEMFPILTHMDGKPFTPAAAKKYKDKIGKSWELMVDPGSQFRPMTRGYQIRKWPKLGIQWNSQVNRVDLDNRVVLTSDGRSQEWDLLVNTLPLHLFYTMCGRGFDVPPQYDPIYVVPVSDPDDMHDVPKVVTKRGMLYVNYVSDLADPVYRWSQWRGVEHRESIVNPETWADPPDTYTTLWPGKLHPWSERKEILEWLQSRKATCFGRFGRWDPEELLHQTWEAVVNWSNKL